MNVIGRYPDECPHVHVTIQMYNCVLQSSLEFNLRQQEFVELVRDNKRVEAVKHARKFFTGLDDHQMTDVQKVMGLLAFPADTKISPYKVRNQ